MEIIAIREHGEWIEEASVWFHTKWQIPAEEYKKSMQECLARTDSIPQWYIVVEQNRIIGGIGVIGNDFHERTDLSPNICALYVEESCRCNGIAGQLLHYVCDDMHSFGIDTLYLVTERTRFYERYGWEFLCMVSCAGEEGMLRMYEHQNQSCTTIPPS